VWGLTFELSGGRREGAWAARRMMTLAASRPKRLAGGRPLERGVRQQTPARNRETVWSAKTRTGRSGGEAECGGAKRLLLAPLAAADCYQERWPVSSGIRARRCADAAPMPC
jgi:hypothetical protein